MVFGLRTLFFIVSSRNFLFACPLFEILLKKLHCIFDMQSLNQSWHCSFYPPNAGSTMLNMIITIAKRYVLRVTTKNDVDVSYLCVSFYFLQASFCHCFDSVIYLFFWFFSHFLCKIENSLGSSCYESWNVEFKKKTDAPNESDRW